MAYWGQALVLGPNINATMNAEDEPKAKALADKAVALKPRATPASAHTSTRLPCATPGAPRIAPRRTGRLPTRCASHGRAFPRDLDAKTIFAESLMDLRPWNYWTRDGEPYPETREIEQPPAGARGESESSGRAALLGSLVGVDRTPERAEAEADRLLPLMPGAGHIVHMPAHIYMRVGPLRRCRHVNQKAVKADEDYIAQCRAQGLVSTWLLPAQHSLHLDGRERERPRNLALESARKVASVIPADALEDVPVLQGFVVVPYWAMVRFGMVGDPRGQGADVSVPLHPRRVAFARGMALSATGRLEDAEKELGELKGILDDHGLDQPVTSSVNSGRAILRIAPEVLAGEIAAKRKDWDTAIQHLDRAVRYEDALVYNEPPDWPAPVRQTLGAVLLAAGRPGEAETVYWDDLRKNPGNGWSLFGVAQALKAQGKTDDATAAETRFRAAWKDADVTLTASRM